MSARLLLAAVLGLLLLPASHAAPKRKRRRPQEVDTELALDAGAQAELQALVADCQARGGALEPDGGLLLARGVTQAELDAGAEARLLAGRATAEDVGDAAALCAARGRPLAAEALYGLLGPADRDAVLASEVKFWHFDMLNDEPRNTAFARAVEAAVRAAPEPPVVLEIGAGSGLLAMVAARAGARRVLACEANSLIADAARRVVAANGLAGRVQILTALSFHVELPPEERADVLVAEVVDNHVIGEHIVPIVRHAREHLLKPGARIIPAGAVLWGQPARSRELVRHFLPPASSETGVDMRAVEGENDALAFRPGAMPFKPLGAPVELARWDFATADDTDEEEREVRLSAPARVVVSWFDLDVGFGYSLTTRPDSAQQRQRTAWLPSMHFLGRAPAEVVVVRQSDGVELRLHARGRLPGPRPRGFKSAAPRVRRLWGVSVDSGSLVGWVADAGGSLGLLPALAAASDAVTRVTTCEGHLSNINDEAGAAAAVAGAAVEFDCDAAGADVYVSAMLNGGDDPLLNVAHFWKTRPAGVRLVPARARVHAALVESPAHAQRYRRAGSFEGLDLSAFNTLAHARLNSLCYLLPDDYALLSEPVVAWEIDFLDKFRAHHSAGHRVEVRRAGHAHAVLFWVSYFVSGSWVPAADLSRASVQRMQYLPEPLPVREGMVFDPLELELELPEEPRGVFQSVSL